MKLLPIISFKGKVPKIDPSALIFETATVIGDVEIGAGSSVWPGVVIRGDLQPIRIGDNTNVQDNAVIHAPSHFEAPVRIGNSVSIGHCAMLHGCEVDDNSLIGIHAVILDKTKVGSWVLVGAGAVVPSNLTIPPKSLVLGVPGKVIRQLDDDDLKYMKNNAKSYTQLVEAYKKANKF